MDGRIDADGLRMAETDSAKDKLMISYVMTVDDLVPKPSRVVQEGPYWLRVRRTSWI